MPSHLPETWYSEHFGDFTDHVPGAGSYTVRHLRRAASLKLVEMTAGGSWRDSARALEIPESQALSTLRKLRRQFGAADLWPRFEGIVERIACHLDELPQQTNYANRRRVMPNWVLSQGDWESACFGLRQADRLTSRHGTAIGTVLVWAEATQADHLLWPSLTDLRTSSTDRRPLIDELSGFFRPSNQRGYRLELRLRLQRYAQDFGARIDATNDHPPSEEG
ncbi:hypothetical protein [Streptomyces sp. NBC_00063]|uniref:hypothetical protein n=1 Tax=Streptomyces sp. NBC_00063 TaxID=2975638 RepID=UPI003D7045EE